eukprot:gene45920-61381_t
MGCGASSRASGNNIINDHPVSGNSGNVGRSAPSQRILAIAEYRHGTPVTQADLVNMRNTFWATRVDGNSHMWNALRTAAEALLSEDFPLANAIIEASNITTPNGNLELCYDERGHQYTVPGYCYTIP